MVYLIHGDDTLASRNYYTSLKNSESITFDAEEINLVELNQAIKGFGFFQSSSSIFLENLFTRKASKNFEEISTIINNSDKSKIYLWSDKEISGKIVAGIRNIEPKVFKIPQNIWYFLDNIKPKSKNNVLEFHQVLASNEPEFVASMLIRQFRLLLGVKSNSLNKIDELKRLAPWQKSKLISQSSFFDTKKLKNTLIKLYEIDKNIKTGKSTLSLTQNIDFLLLEI